MGTKKWSEIRAARAAEPGYEARMDEARKRVAEREEAYFARLADLRRARGATQTALGERASLTQSGVARIERQSDLYVSTLRRYVEALGGELEVRAVFPDQDVEIRFDDFATIDREHPEDTPDLPSPGSSASTAMDSAPALHRAL